MPDNLTVTIGADSSKLRAELALVTQSTRAAQKELDALAATFNKTGSQADRLKLDDKARQLDTFKRNAQSLKSQLDQLAPPFSRVKKGADEAESAVQRLLHTGHGLGRIVNEFSSVSRGMESIGRIFGALGGGFAGGVAGVAITKAFTSLKDQIDAVSKSISELKQTAGEIGIKPTGLQAAREIAKEAGQDASAADKILKSVSDQIDEVRKKSTQQVAEGSGVGILRGTGGATPAGGARMIQVQGDVSQTTTIMRGGAQAATDYSKALEALGIDISNIPVGKLDPMKITILALQRFMEVSKTWDATKLNMVAKALGSTADALKDLAPNTIAELQKRITELQTAPRGVTPAREELNKQLLQSQAELEKSWSDWVGRQDWMAQAEININKMLVANLRPMSEQWKEVTEQMSGYWHMFWDDFARQGESSSDAFLKGMRDLASDFKSIWQTSLDWLSNAMSSAISAAKSAASSVANTVSSGQGDAGIASLFASGGIVRGAGSGTSDSILARLSNGEFVMRAAAVNHWGSDFLASLNGLRNPGFALGGLVSTLPRFAEGGAAATGGTPVHLHLGGSSFPLSGNENVVSALVVEAHRQQMRSAGNKPSWFAARPGGQ